MLKNSKMAKEKKQQPKASDKTTIDKWENDFMDFSKVDDPKRAKMPKMPKSKKDKK